MAMPTITAASASSEYERFRLRREAREPGMTARNSMARCTSSAQRSHSKRCCSNSSAKSQELLILAPFGSPAVHTDISGDLEDERRQRFGLLDSLLAQSLQHSSQRLLRDIFGRLPVAEAAGGEDAEPLPKAIREL